MKRRGVLILGFILLVSELIFGQDREIVTGRIVEKGTGEPVVGATVVVKGTSTGTISDVNGFYTLRDIPQDAVLIFSFVGMKAQEVPVEGRRVINVELEIDSKVMEEVVVVGYGVQRKSDLTGAVASVKGEELQKSAVANVANALQGRVSGVLISPDGAPGKSA